jgi:hypothetical protein
MQDHSKRRRLKEELHAAHVEYLAANALFGSLVTDRPSGLSCPDGSLRIGKAGVTKEHPSELYVGVETVCCFRRIVA